VHNAFALILEDLIDAVPGAIGAIFADWDGEAVDHVSFGAAEEIKLIGAHFGIILRLADISMREKVGAGPVEEVLVEGPQRSFLVRPVTSEYYVVLTIGEDAQMGLARLALAKYAKELGDKM
jgi:predicted regulator of Ras-like GTPase activity (Roadblock/LC7/MglB family)